MIKSWSRICLFVLAISSISRGKNETTEAQPKNYPDTNQGLTPSPAANREGTQPKLPSPSSQNPTSVNTANHMNQTPTKKDDNETFATTTRGTVGITEANVTTSASTSKDPGPRVTASTTTSSTSPKPATASSSSWGYVILAFIILVIIILCVILCLLRRASRMYSFDLQRPNPVNNLNEPTGTFEPVYLDDLDQPAPKDHLTSDDLSTPPVANGTSLQSEEKCSNGESAPQEQPETDGMETSPPNNSSPSSGDDISDKSPSPLSSTNLFFDATGDLPLNENNNNPSCSSGPFVEINLDEPASSDQLLTSPQATSSVLPFTPFTPFTPFSFSSSSSSSSSSSLSS
ncbi:probable serine/threonine-protein kinase dyrk2 [Mastacembelus armatus]|uniref:probable serine/threonine-protein kinase dyrk2 n=1 Tax=Mastacembelus armatus TaxID=205130 RepID=UPI000E461488|nr:probable serine/threonine-protein kinase dyrk2 [Mastacembelus armatus]